MCESELFTGVKGVFMSILTFSFELFSPLEGMNDKAL
jgi:hypothetical protein